MIPASYTELHRLQAEAVELCKNAGAEPVLLPLCTTLDATWREANQEYYAFITARQIAARVGKYFEVYEITAPALAALVALKQAIEQEERARREVETAHG